MFNQSLTQNRGSVALNSNIKTNSIKRIDSKKQLFSNILKNRNIRSIDMMIKYQILNPKIKKIIKARQAKWKTLSK